MCCHHRGHRDAQASRTDSHGAGNLRRRGGPPPLRGVAPQVNGGAYIPVEGEWSAPESLAEAVRDALDDRGISRSTVCGAIIWVHSPHRQSVLDELTRVLNPDARVLQLWGSAAQDPREVMDNEDRPDRPWRTRHLFLGYHRDSGGSRWLTDGEISRATVLAWDSGSEYASAGQLDPWELRP